MTSENDDPIFDAFLEEVFGKRPAPDLSPRILKAWAESRAKANSASAPRKMNGHASKLSLPALAEFDNTASPVAPPLPAHSVQATKTHLQRRDRMTTAVAIGLAASMIGVGLTVGLLAVLAINRQSFLQPSLAANSSVGDRPPAASVATTSSDSRRELPGDKAQDDKFQGDKAQPLAAVESPVLEPEKLAATVPALPSAQPDAPVESSVSPPPQRRTTDAELVTSLNSEFGRLWVSASVKPTPGVSDEQWCARVYRSLLGREAKPGEIKRFLEEAPTTGREGLVDRLLSSARYRDELARHWAAAWTMRLLGPRGGTGNSIANRQELENYLSAALRSNQPINQIVEALLTATGSALPESDDYNPAVNFLLDRWDAAGVQATGRVARVLLGHDLQCAQCHQHPTQSWTQEQFWSLNAFFRQMRVERPGGKPARIVNVDFLGQRRGTRDGEVFFETPTGLMKTAFPRFIDGSEIATSGLLKNVDRRLELARLVTQSDDFARQFVNDIWKQLLGYGLSSGAPVAGREPVANREPVAGPASDDGQLLEARVLAPVAAEFSASGYDLNSLIRWIVLSEPFGRSSQVTDLATIDLPEAGQPPLFSRFYERLPAAGDATRLLVASSRFRTTGQSASARKEARLDWLSKAKRSAKLGPKTGNVSKAEKKSSSAIVAEPISPANLNAPIRDGGLIARLASHEMAFDKKVQHLFEAAIDRHPTPRELGAATEILTANKDDQAGALEDIWWSLVNSSECVLDR